MLFKIIRNLISAAAFVYAALFGYQLIKSIVDDRKLIRK